MPLMLFGVWYASGRPAIPMQYGIPYSNMAQCLSSQMKHLRSMMLATPAGRYMANMAPSGVSVDTRALCSRKVSRRALGEERCVMPLGTASKCLRGYGLQSAGAYREAYCFKGYCWQQYTLAAICTRLRWVRLAAICTRYD